MRKETKYIEKKRKLSCQIGNLLAVARNPKLVQKNRLIDRKGLVMLDMTRRRFSTGQQFCLGFSESNFRKGVAVFSQICLYSFPVMLDQIPQQP
jgi:hypothetical protein